MTRLTDLAVALARVEERQEATLELLRRKETDDQKRDERLTALEQRDNRWGGYIAGAGGVFVILAWLAEQLW